MLAVVRQHVFLVSSHLDDEPEYTEGAQTDGVGDTEETRHTVGGR